MAATTFATHAGSRKCWPKRLRATMPGDGLFDLLDLLLAHPEVVADLVNQRLADRDDEIFFVIAMRARAGP